jgi:hypothetical protein
MATLKENRFPPRSMIHTMSHRRLLLPSLPFTDRQAVSLWCLTVPSEEGIMRIGKDDANIMKDSPRLDALQFYCIIEGCPISYLSSLQLDGMTSFLPEYFTT